MSKLFNEVLFLPLFLILSLIFFDNFLPLSTFQDCLVKTVCKYRVVSFSSTTKLNLSWFYGYVLICYSFIMICTIL